MTQPALQLIQNDEPGLGKPLPVKLSRIERYEGQPRRYFNPQSQQELADDLQINGQKTPVRVCKHSAKPRVFVLIGGERRWRSFGIIRDRAGVDPIVNCFIDTVHDERHHFREAFLDNLQREDLIPSDEAASYVRLYNESKAESHHAKVVEVSTVAKKSTTHVENYLHLARLPESVMRLMDPGLEKEKQLGTSIAIEISKSTRDPNVQLELARESIERNLGIVEARTFIHVKTGKSGYGVGGRMRKPSDDYKAFKQFLALTLNRAERIGRTWELDALYKSRPDEFGDRKRDSATIKLVISHLTGVLKQVEEEARKGGGS